jgi:long-chain fatty acid transport protein
MTSIGTPFNPANFYQRSVVRFSVLLSAGLVLAVGLSPVRLRAEGFRNPPAGAFGLGRAGGRIAQVDDASAIAHNPANLMDLKSPEFSFQPNFVYIATDYRSAGGNANTVMPWKVLPNFFAATPSKDGKLAVGIGVTTPYGLSIDWAQSSPAFASPASLRYTSPHYTELKVINLNPTVAYRVNDRLTVGAGLDVFWSELSIHVIYPWSFFGGTDADVRFKGDGFGFGANVGLTWQVTDRQRLALTVRSPVQVNYDGDTETVSPLPAGAPAGSSSRSAFKSQIKFPTIVAAGYGVQVSDKVRLEADAEWLQFSNFDNLPLDSGNNNVLFTAIGASPNVRQAWKNTFTAGLSGDWRFAPNWVLRASYQYYMSPVRNETFSPSIPDANQNAFTISVGYQHKRHSVEAAFGEVLYDKRTINNNQTAAFNGTYETTVHLFAFSYRFSF